MSQLKPRECQEERTELMLTIRISQKEKPEVLSCPLNHDKALEMGRTKSTPLDAFIPSPEANEGAPGRASWVWWRRTEF